MSILDATEAYAIPGHGSTIDFIDPTTGLTWVNNHTEEEIKERYPDAVRVNLSNWMQAKAALQDTPVEWLPTTHERYMEMLEVLPPALMVRGAFLVGEPSDHHATTGKPRFQMFWTRNEQYFESSRPVRREECVEFLKGFTNLPTNPIRSY